MISRPDRTADYLHHIIEAIERAIAYASRAATIVGLESDALLQDGIIRNIGVIGEAAVKIQQVDPELVGRRTDIPWKAMCECSSRAEQIFSRFITFDGASRELR